MLLSDVEFVRLKKRVADGKKYLEGKWANKDYETQQHIRLWQQLAGELFEQMCMREDFPIVTPHEELLRSAEDKVARIREKLIAQGYVKPAKKERRAAVNETRSEIHPLFATS